MGGGGKKNKGEKGWPQKNVQRSCWRERRRGKEAGEGERERRIQNDAFEGDQ